MITAIIVGAGKSERFGQDKLFLDVLGNPVVHYTISAFQETADRTVVVSSAESMEKYRGLIHEKKYKNIECVLGGSFRQESVYEGLKQCKEGIVLVHDAARPLMTKEIIGQALYDCDKFGSSIPVVSLADSIVRKNLGEIAYISRDNLYAIQTPQAYRFEPIHKAYGLVYKEIPAKIYREDSQLYLAVGFLPHYSNGSSANIKLTYPGDLEIVEAVLKKRQSI